MKEKLKNTTPIFGIFVKINSATIMEIAKWAGFDFVVIDAEHSPFTSADIDNLIRAGESIGLDTIVRIPSPLEEHVQRSLDCGATGVQVPGLKNIADVEKVIQYAKYYPEGTRGLSFAQRAAKYGMLENKSMYTEVANAKNVIVIHVENQEMANNIEELCKVEAVDVVFIGPVDISQSLGKPGDLKDPVVESAINNIFDVCHKTGKSVGIFAGTPADVIKYKELGAKYIVYSSDIGMLVKEATDVLRVINSHN